MRGARTGIIISKNLIVDSSDPIRFMSRQRINEGSLSTGLLTRYLPCKAYIIELTNRHIRNEIYPGSNWKVVNFSYPSL